jgi:hypothetical protein
VKALIQKEIRENVKLAVVGLLVGFVLLLLTAQLQLTIARALASGRMGAGDFDMLQPLASPVFNTGVNFFCAIFGAILGWVQIHNERHRDLWGFLVHRPVTRTDIFLGKALSGLGIYFCVAAVPLLCFVLWLRFFSPRVAPFEWAMIQSSLVSLVAGIAYYFAGMLTSIRQARWYASRGLALLFALVISGFTLEVPSFWVAAMGGLLGAGFLALAVWGAFHVHGADSAPQPLLARLALSASLAGGAFLAATVLTGILINSTFYSAGPPDYSYWSMTKNGDVYKITGSPRSGVRQIVDLEAKPLMDPATGQPMDFMAFNRLNSRHIGLWPVPEAQGAHWRSYRHRSRFFLAWDVTADTAWYFWRTYGRLVAFDVRNHQIVGSLGPDGFVPGSRPGGPGFLSPAGYNPTMRVRTLRTHTGVYAVDLAKRAVKPFFTATADDPILASEDVLLNSYDWDYTVIVTRRSVQLLRPNAELVWKTPHDVSGSSPAMVQVYFLEPPGQFALWKVPDTKENSESPIEASWLSSDKGITKTVELPRAGMKQADLGWQHRLSNVLLPAVSVIERRPLDWAVVAVALAAAILIYIPLVCWLGNRYALPLSSRLAWAAFTLPAGFPAFVAFLSTHDWPARKQCAACGKLRVVDREKCEHCDADFPPSKAIGTEIFEPLTT